MSPTVVVGGCLDRVAQLVHQRRVGLELRGRFGGLRLGYGFRWGAGTVGVSEVLGVDELVERGDEGLGRLPLAESVHGEAGLAQSRGESCEVAVAGNDAESV